MVLRDPIHSTISGVRGLRNFVIALTCAMAFYLLAYFMTFTKWKYALVPFLIGLGISLLASFVLLVFAYVMLFKGSSHAGSIHRMNLILGAAAFGSVFVLWPIFFSLNVPIYNATSSEPSTIHKFAYTFFRLLINVPLILIIYLPVRELCTKAEARIILYPLFLWFIASTVISCVIGPWSRGSINMLSIIPEVFRIVACSISIYGLALIGKRSLERDLASDGQFGARRSKRIFTAPRNSAIMMALLIPVILILSIPGTAIPPGTWNVNQVFLKSHLQSEYQRIEAEDPYDSYLQEGGSELHPTEIEGQLVTSRVTLSWFDEPASAGWTNMPDTFTLTVEVEGFEPLTRTDTSQSGNLIVDFNANDYSDTHPFVHTIDVTVSMDDAGDFSIARSPFDRLTQPDEGNSFSVTVTSVYLLNLTGQ